MTSCDQARETPFTATISPTETPTVLVLELPTEQPTELPTATAVPPTPTEIPPTPIPPTPIPVVPTRPPTLTPPPPPAQAAAAPDASSILGIIASYDWPYHEAVEVARCESGLNPNARNPSGATGLFQIIGGNPAMFDPETNVAAAYAKYLDGLRRGNRWYHWNAFGSCGHFY